MKPKSYDALAIRRSTFSCQQFETTSFIMSEYIDTQPEPVTPMGRISVVSQKLNNARTKVTTKAGWVGTFDYRWLCMPVSQGVRRRYRISLIGSRILCSRYCHGVSAAIQLLQYLPARRNS